MRCTTFFFILKAILHQPVSLQHVTTAIYCSFDPWPMIPPRPWPELSTLLGSASGSRLEDDQKWSWFETWNLKRFALWNLVLIAYIIYNLIYFPETIIAIVSSSIFINDWYLFSKIKLSYYWWRLFVLTNQTAQIKTIIIANIIINYCFYLCSWVKAAKKLPMPNLGTFTLGDESRLKLSNWSLGRGGRWKMGTSKSSNIIKYSEPRLCTNSV